MINEQTVKDIQGAIKVIKKRGWTKGKFEKYTDGPVCLAGALRVSIFGTAYPLTPIGVGWTRMYDARDLLETVVGMGLEKFNDRDGTKRRDVIRALKRASERGVT